MQTIYDLHTHSTASDGSVEPRELVAQANALGIQHLALTDHDTTNGLAEARAAAMELDINFIDGIELSAKWDNTSVHIVGLNIDPLCREIKALTTRLADIRDQRAMRIGEKLAKVGIERAYENAKRIAGTGTVTRQHFSQFLVASGYAKSQSDVFRRFLVRNKPGYVSVDWPSLEETIESIHRASGVAVIAHPLRYKMTASKLRRLITAFKDNAGEAIEVVTGHNDPAEIQLATNYARQYKLAASTGSDFHNEQTPWARLGKLSLLPEGVTPVWQCWS